MDELERKITLKNAPDPFQQWKLMEHCQLV